MFEVVIDGLEYIRDVPVEMTEEAIVAGMLKRGCVVGLLIHPTNDPKNKVLVEVRLMEDGQESLIRRGAVVPLEGQGGRFRFAGGWGGYLKPAGVVFEGPLRERVDEAFQRPQPHF